MGRARSLRLLHPARETGAAHKAAPVFFSIFLLPGFFGTFSGVNLRSVFPPMPTPFRDGEVDADAIRANVRKWIRVALAAEISGLLHAAIAATVEHLSVRKQFGRPLGTFQALRHRLAECQVLAGGVRLLALRAAGTGLDGDAALAAFHAQESGTRIAYEVHQMHGGMGMTLEHPLHLWTYRLKALLSALGGRAGQANAAAKHGFGARVL